MEIFEKLKPNTTIITPNRRLTATLLEKHQEYGLMKNELCWPTLDILPYQSWVQRLWNDASMRHMDTPPILLSNQQEQVLWEDIVRQSPKYESLLQLSATAELAKSAWGVLKQWLVDIHHPMLTMTEDSQAFQQWAMEFEQRSETNHWIDFNTMAQQIIGFVENHLVIVPDEIMVVGFTELSPLQKTLFEKFETCGTKLHVIENPYAHKDSIDKKSFFISLTDDETEIITMAKWAKQLADQHKTNPSLKIGCIIPNLENNRDRIVQIFSAVFPELDFNISAGKSLLSYPIIHAAIQILQLQDESISFEKISYLLRTPFIGEAETELTKRAMFDSHLRSENITIVRLNEIEKLNIDKYCPQLAKRIQALTNKNTLQNQMALPSSWVAHMMEVLSIMGWPGERSINSQEYQIVQRFLDLLNEYQAFDTVTEEISYSKAIEHLQRLCKKTIFQPQSKNAPVQILGLLEAATLPFDYAWIVGLDDSAWPPAAKPNPFLPHKLQKTLKMPHATADKEHDYSAKLTYQFKQCANTIIFSHALKSGDCDLRPSALISDCKKLDIKDIEQCRFTNPAETIFHTQQIESISDEQGPPVESEEKLRGGVSILKQQAACAFKAFSEIRLHAYKLESPNIGLRPQDRGTMTHKALELVWKTIKDHDNLIHLDDDELRELIDTCVKESMQPQQEKLRHQPRYLDLEAQRLSDLLWKWLQLEKTRPPFKVISNEEERTFTIGIIPVTLRVDRIDELDDGSHMIIDYKTGKYNSTKYWFGERPEEPQLPLYCISDKSEVKAIAFADIHPDNLTLHGVSESNSGIDKIKPLSDLSYVDTPDWNAQIETWKKTFEKLASEFAQGNAAVSPKNEVETCQYCDLKPLCRIHEHQAE